jgi:hypothetical protein
MAAMINFVKYAYDYGCRIYFVQRDQKTDSKQWQTLCAVFTKGTARGQISSHN